MKKFVIAAGMVLGLFNAAQAWEGKLVCDVKKRCECENAGPDGGTVAVDRAADGSCPKDGATITVGAGGKQVEVKNCKPVVVTSGCDD